MPEFVFEKTERQVVTAATWEEARDLLEKDGERETEWSLVNVRPA